MRIFQRLDFEVAAFGLAVGAVGGLLSLRGGDVLPYAATTGALWATGAIATVYGLRIVGQALPFPNLPRAAGDFAHTVASASDWTLPDFRIPERVEIETPMEDTTREDAWREALGRFILAADIRQSFARRELGSAGGQYVSDYNWARCVAALKTNAILETQAGGALGYARGWEKRRARFWVRYESVTLPDGHAPRVTI